MRSRAFWSVMLGVMLTLGVTTAVGAATTHTDPQGRISFSVPDGYRKTDTAGALVAYYSPTYTGANFNIGAFNGSGGSNLDDVATGILKTLKDTFKDFQPGPKGVETTTIAGKPARRYEYSATVGDFHAHGVQYLVVNGTTAYFLTFTASDSDFAGFIKESSIVLDSFTFLSGTGTPGATTTVPTAGTSPTTTVPAPSTPVAPVTASPATASASGLSPFFVRRLGDG